MNTSDASNSTGVVRQPVPGGRKNILPEAVYEADARQEMVQFKGSAREFRSNNISIAEALALYEVVRQLRPAVSAEVGMCKGVSTLAILQSLEDIGGGIHHAIDPYQGRYWKNRGVENIRQAGLSHRLVFHETFVEEAAPHLPPLQFGFIDGSHLFDLTMVDFALLDKRLETGGVLGFHDLWMPALRRLMRFILLNRRYRPWSPPAAGEAAGTKRRFKACLAGAYRTLTSLPGLDRCLTQQVIAPWWTMGLEGNMVFLQKTGTDERDYKDYREF